jgi:hypothetical protein
MPPHSMKESEISRAFYDVDLLEQFPYQLARYCVPNLYILVQSACGYQASIGTKNNRFSHRTTVSHQRNTKFGRGLGLPLHRSTKL